MRNHLVRLILTAGCLTAAMGLQLAHAATLPANCKVVQGPGFYSQACGDNAQVSGGPGQSSASTGTPPVPPAQSVVPPVPVTPLPQFTPVVEPPKPAAPVPPARSQGGGGLLSGLLRLLGLGN